MFELRPRHCNQQDGRLVSPLSAQSEFLLGARNLRSPVPATLKSGDANLAGLPSASFTNGWGKLKNRFTPLNRIRSRLVRLVLPSALLCAWQPLPRVPRI